MTRPIGYYAHHQGAGHRHRAQRIAAASRHPIIVMGSFGSSTDALMNLPDDRTTENGFAGRDGAADRPHAFHYAPVHVVGVRERMARIASWIGAERPALFVVDVSVEVALFARLLSVPVVFVRLAGQRDDPPHLEAFRAAEALLAPFPEAFESETTPAWVRDKTIYGGFIGAPCPSEHSQDTEPGRIAVVIGRGGRPVDTAALAAAARSTPDRNWEVYGSTTGDTRMPANLHLHGWTPNLDAALARAEIVVGGAGDGVIADVVARGKRFLCLPEPRPFGEQHDKARRMADLGLAIVRDDWPEAEAWPRLLRDVERLDPARLQAHHDPLAAHKVAAALESIAGR